MKIYYISILKPCLDGKSYELTADKDLSSFSFFERGQVGSFMKFFAETLSSRTKPGQRQSIEEGNYLGHTFVTNDNLAGVLITDKEYPIRPAYTLLNKLLEEFVTTYPPSSWANVNSVPDVSKFKLNSLGTYLSKYQDPSQADALMRVQQEIDETKIVLHKTIDSLLKRGESLDSLVDKSESLSASSKMFYTHAKKTNSCCIIM